MPSILCAEATAAEDVRKLMDTMVDVTSPQVVDVSTAIGVEGKPILWVNVNGVCVLRACRIDNLTFSTLAPLVQLLSAEIGRCGSGIHDPTPTRLLWPNNSDAAKVDQWWATYHLSAVLAYRDLATEARATLNRLAKLIGKG
jgi:hypothetical protein